MVVIAVVILLVIALSLYDYFSSIRWQQVTSGNRNDIVFEARNKQYGAYQIRKNYNLTLILIMSGLVLSVGIAYGAYVVIKNLPKEEEKEVIVETTQFSIDAPPVEEDIEEPPVQEEIPPMEKSIEFIAPVVTDKEVTTTMATQETLETTSSSTVTNDTDTPNFGKIIETPTKPVVEEKKPEVVFEDVEESAEYPGGRAEMMKFLQQNMRYPETASQAGIEGRCYLKFVVGTDGTITDVRVLRGVPDCPECDKEAVRVVRSMPKWKAGKNGGKAVKSYFNLPVSFKLN